MYIAACDDQIEELEKLTALLQACSLTGAPMSAFRPSAAAASCWTLPAPSASPCICWTC